MYTCNIDKSIIYRNILVIENAKNVSMVGSRIAYRKGEIRLIGEDLYIYLYGRTNALCIAKLGYMDWEKINKITGAYTTFSNSTGKAGTGSMVIIREKNKSSFDLEVAELGKDTEEYKNFEDLGIVQVLNRHYIE